MVGASLTRIPRPRRPRRRRGRPPRGPRLYRVGDFVLAYAVALLANAACLVMAPPLLLLAYPASGIALS